jgi:hypothetical protein
MRGRVVAPVHLHAHRLDHVDSRRHHREHGVVGGQEVSEPPVVGFYCDAT